MWAGKVLSIFRARSPRVGADGMPTYDAVLEVEWHSPCLERHTDRPMIDADMNVPLVQKEPANNQHIVTRFYLAQNVAPVQVNVLEHPSLADVLCVLARNFAFMRCAGWEPLAPVTRAAARLGQGRA